MYQYQSGPKNPDYVLLKLGGGVGLVARGEEVKAYSTFLIFHRRKSMDNTSALM